MRLLRRSAAVFKLANRTAIVLSKPVQGPAPLPSHAFRMLRIEQLIQNAEYFYSMRLLDQDSSIPSLEDAIPIPTAGPRGEKPAFGRPLRTNHQPFFSLPCSRSLVFNRRNISKPIPTAVAEDYEHHACLRLRKRPGGVTCLRPDTAHKVVPVQSFPSC